jgi:uncharacterized RDD family membrane protein YckC
MIDVIVFNVAAGVVAVPLGFAVGLSMAGSPEEAAQAVGFLLGLTIGLVGSWLYFALTEASPWQATLGKKALGLRVTDTAGGRISFARASGRFWSKLLSGFILGIGFVMIAFTERRQGLHDLVAGTLVERKRV